jgi:hypothetical protein
MAHNPRVVLLGTAAAGAGLYALYSLFKGSKGSDDKSQLPPPTRTTEEVFRRRVPAPTHTTVDPVPVVDATPPPPRSEESPRTFQPLRLRRTHNHQFQNFRFHDFRPSIDPRLLQQSQRQPVRTETPAFDLEAFLRDLNLDGERGLSTAVDNDDAPSLLPIRASQSHVQRSLDNPLDLDALVQDILRRSERRDSLPSASSQRADEVVVVADDVASRALVSSTRRHQLPRFEELTRPYSRRQDLPRLFPNFDFSGIDLKRIFGEGPIQVSVHFSSEPTTRLAVLPQLTNVQGDGEEVAESRALVPSSKRVGTPGASEMPTVVTVVLSSDVASVATQINLADLFRNQRLDDETQQTLVPFTADSRGPRDFSATVSPELLGELLAGFAEFYAGNNPVVISDEELLLPSDRVGKQLLLPSSELTSRSPQVDRHARMSALSLSRPLPKPESEEDDEDAPALDVSRQQRVVTADRLSLGSDEIDASRLLSLDPSFTIFYDQLLDDEVPALPSSLHSATTHSDPRPGFRRIEIVEVDDEEEDQQRRVDEELIVPHTPVVATAVHPHAPRLPQFPGQGLGLTPSAHPLSHSHQQFDDFEEDDVASIQSLPLPRRHYTPSPSYYTSTPTRDEREDDRHSIRSTASTVRSQTRRPVSSLDAVNRSVIERNARKQQKKPSGKGLGGVVDRIIDRRQGGDKDKKDKKDKTDKL